MKEKKYVVVTRHDRLFDHVRETVRIRNPKVTVQKAGSFPEALAMLNEFDGTGILLTDEDAHTIVAQTLPSVLPAYGEQECPQDLRGNTRDEVAFVKMYIRLHLQEDLSLAVIARQVNLSPNYLCVIFRRVEGMSIQQFVEQQRIERAAYLLVTENTLTEEIAHRVGYRYSSYFCRTFRKHYGVTPRRYRLMSERERDEQLRKQT